MSEDWGFTGSSRYVTEGQRIAFLTFVGSHDLSWFRHGDCIKADATAHEIMRAIRPEVHIHGHPPDNPIKRAFCAFDSVSEPLPYLDRNKAIVRAANRLLAMPHGMEEARSGTWFTIRYARRLHRPIAIFWPDGSIGIED